MPTRRGTRYTDNTAVTDANRNNADTSLTPTQVLNNSNTRNQQTQHIEDEGTTRQLNTNNQETTNESQPPVPRQVAPIVEYLLEDGQHYRKGSPPEGLPITLKILGGETYYRVVVDTPVSRKPDTARSEQQSQLDEEDESDDDTSNYTGLSDAIMHTKRMKLEQNFPCPSIKKLIPSEVSRFLHQWTDYEFYIKKTLGVKHANIYRAPAAGNVIQELSKLRVDVNSRSVIWIAIC